MSHTSLLIHELACPFQNKYVCVSIGFIRRIFNQQSQINVDKLHKNDLRICNRSLLLSSPASWICSSYLKTYKNTYNICLCVLWAWKLWNTRAQSNRNYLPFNGTLHQIYIIQAPGACKQRSNHLHILEIENPIFINVQRFAMQNLGIVK